jgi:hypothetical protein
MKALAWIFSRSRPVNFNTAIARQKLARTMPGQTGALASLRLTGCGL